MKTKDECIAVLKQFKEEFASKYGIRSIGIFGSVARGENHPDSDVDVFVDLEEADPFIMFDIRETLQSLFGCKVDLVRLREGLRTLLLKRIEQDGIYAYTERHLMEEKLEMTLLINWSISNSFI